MEGIALNKNVITISVRMIRDIITVQSRARSWLLKDLTNVCIKCDDAYASLLTRLKPVRAAMNDPDKLAVELRAIASDATARKEFKPEKLCTEIEKLLLDLSDNVNALKYSVNILTLSRGIESGKRAERAALTAHADSSIDELQKSLQVAVKVIRKAKTEALSLAR